MMKMKMQLCDSNSIVLTQNKRKVDFLSKQISRQQKILNKYDNNSLISEIKPDDLVNLVSCAEESAIAMRCEGEGPIERTKNDENDELKYSIGEFPVTVSVENGTIRLFLPYLFHSSRSRYYPICDYVRCELDRFINKNGAGVFWGIIKPPLCVIAKRYVKSKKARMTDNDNFAACSELNAVINTVILEIMARDDWRAMDFYSVFTTSSARENNPVVGTELIFFEKSKENILRFINDLV